ncbi:hypothetical protein GCM10023318_30630 [Nocardia callitridis]|uniref:ABC transporter permease n=1 Tax=Nocardia callitridis TaxID=648753 RepID=A0ABP9KDL1_9NOCA
MTGVSGSYLAASDSGTGRTDHALAAALPVRLVMVVLSLIFAIADLRRRAVG